MVGIDISAEMIAMAKINNKNQPSLFFHETIENHSLNVHKAIDYMSNPPKGVVINQIAPKIALKSGVFAISANQITEDYRHGLQCGLDYVSRSLYWN